MSRPLLISDCDEVLLHMVGHFAEWIEEAHGLRFSLEEPGFANAVRYIDSGEAVPADKVSWRAAELSKAAHGGGVMHLGTAVGHANFAAQHAARSGTAGSKVLDDAAQAGLRILRDPELPGERVP